MARVSIVATFGAIARMGELSTPDGALALVLLLDQFPRNAFRGPARMYATDRRIRPLITLEAAGAASIASIRRGGGRLAPKRPGASRT